MALRRVYEGHLRGEARRDLRFKPQMDQHLDEVQQYKNLPVGDLWEDAHLLPVLDYLMNSKLLRTASCFCFQLLRQPVKHLLVEFPLLALMYPSVWEDSRRMDRSNSCFLW